MYLPLLDVGEPFSPFVWIRDTVQAFVLYLFAFLTSTSGGFLSQSATQNAGVPGANDGQYLIGVGIGDVTGYVTPFYTFIHIPCLISAEQPSRRD